MNKRILSKTVLIVLLSFSLYHCASTINRDGPPTANIDVSKIPNAKPRYLPKSRYGNPASYVVYGKRYYVLKSTKHYNRTGIGSWYGTKFHGRLTSTRKPYNMFAMTAASPNLPIPCFVRVTNLKNNRQVVVKVNDRGPFAPNRIIDLSWAAAKKLGFANKGTTLVRVTALDIPTDKSSLRHPKLFLQLGAFSHYGNASRLKKRAEQLAPSLVTVSHTRQHPLYRVQVGPLTGVEQSDRLLNAFSKAGYRNVFSLVE